MALKICQLCAVDFTLKNFLLPLIDDLKRSNFEVKSVCSYGPAVEDLRARGYKIDTIYIERSLRLISHIRSVWQLYHYFKREEFDIVHVHSPIAALVGRIAAWFAGVPVIIYTAHGFYFHEGMPWIKRELFICLEKLGGLFTDLLFTQSKEDAEIAAARKLVKFGQIISIGNGVDPNRFDPKEIGDGQRMRVELGLPHDAVVITVIARLVREKGILEFSHAAMAVAQQRENVFFLVIGQRLDSDHDKDVSNSLEETVSHLGNRFRLLGQRDDIPELLSCTDVFCLPSWREGMPRTIIEAMMMAKAVIATDIRGSREEVLDQKTGLLVPVKNPDVLEDALIYAVDNPEKIAIMGQEGRRRALSLFDETKITATQITYINSVIKEKRGDEEDF